jgi:hypothetical protein
MLFPLAHRRYRQSKRLPGGDDLVGSRKPSSNMSAIVIRVNHAPSDGDSVVDALPP